MVHFYTEEDKKKLTVRLNRISGQLNGITRMIQEDRDCIEVLNQILSTQSALKGLWKQVVKGHLKHCVTKSLENDTSTDEIINELVEHIEKLK